MTASTPVRARFAGFEVDEANARLLCNGQPVPLAPRPFALLCALVRRSGSLLTKHQLLDEVWGHQFVSDSVLKTSISDLRTALADDPRRPRYIETVSRRGYRFIAPTAKVTSSEPPVLPAGPPAGASRAPIVGREQELARLRRAWDAACNGKSTIFLVAGEPGIGKTALIEHFISVLGGPVCARGQCVDQFGAGEPYLPILEALAELCRADATLADLLRTVAPAWLLQMPWLSSPEERDRLRKELAGVAPDRMLRELGELLARCAERQPLLLVTEDLHWADRATVQLIDYVARRRGPARFMWLASFRLAEVVATDHPLSTVRHELRLHHLCEEIVLDPFSETEVAACVAMQSPSLAKDEAFVRALHERTDGVPLFVTSVMREVIRGDSSDAGDPTQAARLAQTAVPENLAGIVDRYMARLAPAQRELLAAAAVAGAEFRVTSLSRVLERDEASVEMACEELARERLWLTTPKARPGSVPSEARYAFGHSLFRQILYDRTTPLARALLHRKVGETLLLERTSGARVPATELAMHFERGQERAKALQFYAEAAQAALQLTPMDCLDLTKHASSLLDSMTAGAERDSLEVTLATLHGISAFQVLGVGDETKAAFAGAYALLAKVERHRMQALALHGYGWVLSLRAEYAEALAVAARAENLAASAQDPILLLAAATVQATVHMLQGRPREARIWIERVLPVLDSVEAASGRSFAADPGVTLLAALGLQNLHLGDVRQARERLDQALARAEEIRQPVAQLVALWYRAMFELRLGEAVRVKAVAQEMRALVEKFSLSLGRAASHWFSGWADARLGLPREGAAEIRAAHEDDLLFGMTASASENLGYQAEALLLANDLPAAQQALTEALEVADRHSERIYLPQLHLIQAAIAEARNEHAAAEHSIRRAVAEARAQAARWLELLALVQLCGSRTATVTDRRELGALLEQLPEAADTEAAGRARALLHEQ